MVVENRRQQTYENRYMFLLQAIVKRKEGTPEAPAPGRLEWGPSRHALSSRLDSSGVTHTADNNTEISPSVPRGRIVSSTTFSGRPYSHGGPRDKGRKVIAS